MKGDGGKKWGEEKGRAEKETPATGERAQKAAWRTAGRENRHALVWGRLVSWYSPGHWDPGQTGGERARPRAEGRRGRAEDHAAILAGCTPRKVKRTPEVRTWHRLWVDSSPASLPCHPTASQPQTKTRASKAAQKVAGWREQGRGRTEQENRQTDRQRCPGIHLSRAIIS